MCTAASKHKFWSDAQSYSREWLIVQMGGDTPLTVAQLNDGPVPSRPVPACANFLRVTW